MVHLNAYMERVLVGSSESLGCAIGVQPSQATRKDLLFEIPCEFAVSRGRENLLENDPMWSSHQSPDFGSVWAPWH